MAKKNSPKHSSESPQPSLKVSPLPFGARLLSAEDVIKLGVTKRDLGGIHNSGRLEPLLIKEVTNASLQAAVDELRLLANDLNHYNYSDPWLIDRAARLSLGPFGELYCDLHKAKTPQQKELKSIVYQIMGLLRDITRRQCSKTCADDLRHLADRFNKCLVKKPGTQGGALKTPLPDTKPECDHSDDFKWVLWYGQEFTFNSTQAVIISLFWKGWKEGQNSIHQNTIAAGISTSSRSYHLVDSFRQHKRYHPAWRRMIHHLGKGIYILRQP